MSLSLDWYYFCRLDLCFVEGLSPVGDLWRFLPVFDPGVSVVVSRDLDSLLTSREAAAVTQWLEETSLPFHVMRYSKTLTSLIDVGPIF